MQDNKNIWIWIYFKCFSLSQIQLRDSFDTEKQRKMKFFSSTLRLTSYPRFLNSLFTWRKTTPHAAATSSKSPTGNWDSHVTFISLVITVHRCTLVPASVSFLYLGDMKRVVTRNWLTLVRRNTDSIFRPRDGWNWVTFRYTRQLDGLATSRIKFTR